MEIEQRLKACLCCEHRRRPWLGVDRERCPCIKDGRPIGDHARAGDCPIGLHQKAPADIRLSVVLTTTGRPTLPNMLKSLKLLEHDELIVICDGRKDAAYPVLTLFDFPCPVRFIEHAPQSEDPGHSLRNQYSSLARGDYVLHADDDDMYTIGAFDQIRNACAQHFGAMLVFKLLRPLKDSGPVPTKRVVEVGQIGTTFVAVPNDPQRWGVWGTHYTGDYDFFAGCKFPVKWVDHTITMYRPHEWPEWPATAEPPYRAVT